VATVRDVARIALWIAITGSVMVSALLAASEHGIWMEGAYLNPTPRINAYTVGMGLVPIPGVAWIVYLWSRTRPVGLFDIALRLIISAAVVVGAAYCWLLGMFMALFVG
jgi:hypothetical protein